MLSKHLPQMHVVYPYSSNSLVKNRNIKSPVGFLLLTDIRKNLELPPVILTVIFVALNLSWFYCLSRKQEDSFEWVISLLCELYIHYLVSFLVA